MSIDLVIGEDHGNRAFRASININAKFTPGRNITRISSLAHFQRKKVNGENMGNTVMAPIGDRLYNIFALRFLCWTHQGKTQFGILPHGCHIPPREKNMQFSKAKYFSTVDLDLYAIVVGKEGISPHWFFY